MRSPSRIDHAVQQEQASPFCVLPGRKHNVSSRTVVACSRERSLNILRAAKLFRAISHVQSVQPLMIVSGSVLRHCDHVNRAVRARFGVDDRSRSDADFRRDLPATVIVAGGFASGQHRDLPEKRSAVGIETVDAAMLRLHIQDVVRPLVGNADLREVERLRIHSTVHIDDKELPETRRVDVARCENGFRKILSGARGVVVIRRDVGSRCARRRRWWRGLFCRRTTIAAHQMQCQECSLREV